MKRVISPWVLLGLAGALLCPLLAGCSHQGASSTMSQEDQKNFKGGPMPPEAQKGFAEMQRRNARPGAPGPAGAPGPGGPPAPAAPPGPPAGH